MGLLNNKKLKQNRSIRAKKAYYWSKQQFGIDLRQISYDKSAQAHFLKILLCGIS
jgi:hypothetical protein